MTIKEKKIATIKPPVVGKLNSETLIRYWYWH
jgi:hypothetical protein